MRTEPWATGDRFDPNYLRGFSRNRRIGDMDFRPSRIGPKRGAPPDAPRFLCESVEFAKLLCSQIVPAKLAIPTSPFLIVLRCKAEIFNDNQQFAD